MIHGFWKQGSQKSRVAYLLIAATGLAACINTAAAAEVYTWTDKDGITHFSDRPPASGNAETMEIEDSDIPAPPASATSAPHNTENVTGSETAAPQEQPLTAAQQRRQQLAKEREDRREAQGKVDILCGKHRQRLAQVEPARRVFYTDDSGQSVRMDDDMRIALVQESKDFIAKNCE